MAGGPSTPFSSALPNAAVHVTSVTQVGGNTNEWTFDTAITSAVDAVETLTINTASPTNFNTQSGPNSVWVDYDDEHPAGQAWAVTGPPAGLTFTGGAVLGPQSGTVT